MRKPRDKANDIAAALWLSKTCDLRPSEAEAIIVALPAADVRAIVRLIGKLEVQP